MNWSQSTALGAALFLATTVPALSWGVWTEGPDVFGSHKALASTSNGRNTLVVQCDTEEFLHMAYLIPVKEFEDIPDRPATFLIQVDDGEPKRFAAAARGWNNNNAGVVVSGRTKELADIVLLLGSAKSKINIGYEIAGVRDSASFSARGSTAAIRTIDATCKLSAIAE